MLGLSMVIAEQELDYNLDSDALAPYYFGISMATVLHFDLGNEPLRAS
jgi:hypothetical protein